MQLWNSINDILFWIFLVLMAWNASILVFNRGIPNIHTAPALRRAVIDLLKKAKAGHSGPAPFTIIDMGSGNGLFTRQIAKSMPDAHVIGIELSPLAFAWSVFLKKRLGLANLDYKKEDFFTTDVSQADAVTLYLVPFELNRLGRKLNAEMKKGAIVTSNRFRLGADWTPSETIQVKTLYPHQKRLTIYHKT